ncbi:hypothetical protein KIN20_037323 [Parelaphostrongylus tenuis]|uniref:Uncharacterized protein n=1 Tax=Parelaphostrongylus tenuis TaxID=148309 RepID=A0AAD5RE88_PARTN|nr:hypothetical protein KIN20_037323 [Parelaphostrongylus tenuis]
MNSNGNAPIGNDLDARTMFGMWTIAPYERSRNKRITKSPTVIDLTKDEPEEIVPSDSDTNESDETGRCSSLDGFAITMNPSETAFCSSLKEAEQLAVRNTKWLLLSITTGDQESVEILESRSIQRL